MGRPDEGLNLCPDVAKFYLRNILTDGAYDEMGAYWGLGKPAYWAFSNASEGVISFYFRAASRGEAKQIVMDEFPETKVSFYR